jgi:hypothetical protein
MNRIGTWLGAPRLTAAVALAITMNEGDAQAVWQADVRVQLLEVTALRPAPTLTARRSDSTTGAQQLSARVVITSDNDDDARSVRLDILLPVGAGVIRYPSGCQASPSAVSTLTGRVTCDLGNIPVRGLREIVISTTGTVSKGARFAAIVTSDTPDPTPGNNFAEQVVP